MTVVADHRDCCGGSRAGREHAVCAVRRMIEQLLCVRDDDARLLDIAGALGEVAAMLERRTTGTEDDARRPGVSLGDPVTGAHNALAPPVRLGSAGSVITGEVRFTLPYQGPKGLAHGGYMAMTLGHALATAVSQGMPGVQVTTERLMIRYRRPVRLNTPATVIARPAGNAGHRLRAVGELRVAGALAVSAEGLYVRRDGDRRD